MATTLDHSYIPTATRNLIVEKEFGEVAPGCSLIEVGGEYGIMNEGKLILKFPGKPMPDPDPDDIHEDGPELSESVEWTDEVMRWVESTRVKPEVGYVLCKAARKAGWIPGDNYGYVLMWFYNEAGVLLGSA